MTLRRTNFSLILSHVLAANHLSLATSPFRAMTGALLLCCCFISRDELLRHSQEKKNEAQIVHDNGSFIIV